MCPERHRRAPRRAHRERGLGLISAIALIVLVAAISAALAHLLQQNANADAAGLLRARAIAAAESGLELALNRAYAPAGTGSCGSRTYTFTVNGLRGCSAVTSCTTTTAAAQTYYDLDSRGTCTAGDASSSRAVRARSIGP